MPSLYDYDTNFQGIRKILHGNLCVSTFFAKNHISDMFCNEHYKYRDIIYTISYEYSNIFMWRCFLWRTKIANLFDWQKEEPMKLLIKSD